ncbi:MAG: hypothetical protein AAGH70_06460, partial [Pseudomonadota bacterium]
MLRAFIFLLCVASCGRVLTSAEEAMVQDIFGDTLEPAQVRIVENAPLRSFTINLPPRPRTTCQER